ncbi:MAG: site-specific integrase [Deltaproteobacteria bacterium]|nr:site-specific integrase [Deltaproteobacteria bacterium]
MNHPLGSFIKRFFSHYLLVQKGLSVNTILAYRDAVKLLLCYAADTVKKAVDELTVEDISEKIVLGFLDHLEQIRGCSTRTRNARLAAIRSLFEYIARQEPVLLVHCAQIRAIPLKGAEHKTVDYLNEKEMQAVLDAIEVNSRTGMRDRALLMLLYNTGARVSEIVALELDDLRLDDSAQIRLLTKGRKERSCPLWPETVTALKSYLHQRAPKEPDTQRVFLNANGVPITRFGIRYITRKYGAQAQVKQSNVTAKRVNPHTIRHTSAMHLLRAGNDVNMVNYWLGHANINTTHIYVEIDMEMKRKMIAKAGAPNVSNKIPWQQPHVLQWLNQLVKKPQLCGLS